MTTFTPLGLDGSMNADQSRASRRTGNSSYQRQGSDDGISLVSFQSQKTTSTTDGIDVLGEEPPPPGTFLNWNTSWTGRIVNDQGFKRSVIALIILDSLLMGIATFDFVTRNSNVQTVFSALNTTFLVLFTVELIIRLLHHRKVFFTNGWTIFDMVVIGCSWISSFLTVMRTFRVIRSLRIATHLKGLRNMTLALYQVIPKMLSVTFVMALSFYVFSIMFTDLYKDLYKNGYTDQDYFSSVPITAFTLFQMMTLDQWSTITNEVQLAHPWAWVLFVGFVLSSAFFILNLTVAVVYEAVVRVQKNHGSDGIMNDQGLVDSSVDASTATNALSRLEEKLDSLANSVELLLRKQMLLQSSVTDMSSQH